MLLLETREDVTRSCETEDISSHLVDISVGAAAYPLYELVVVLRVPPADVCRHDSCSCSSCHGMSGRSDCRSHALLLLLCVTSASLILILVTAWAGSHNCLSSDQKLSEIIFTGDSARALGK